MTTPEIGSSKIENSSDRLVPESNLEITPEQARVRLVTLGFTEDMWDSQMQDERGSHFTRALITIAKGDNTENLNNIYQMFPEKQSETEADKVANSASETAKWELPKYTGQVVFNGIMRAGDVLVTPQGNVIAPQHPSVPPDVAANAPEIPQDDIA